MSDWYGTSSVSESINAGLDLEMPGMEKWRTPNKVLRTIMAHKVTVSTIKERARKVLEMVKESCKYNADVCNPLTRANCKPVTLRTCR